MTAAPFGRRGVFALIAGGFALFIAALWLIASGEGLGGDGDRGAGHAAAKGLNGFAGLVRLAEAEGYAVTRSRSPAGLETDGLLVLTPPAATDPAQFAALLKKREMIGPTLVILPKWNAVRPPPNLPAEARDKFKRGWVILGDASLPRWTADLPAPYRLDPQIAQSERSQARWQGLGERGVLPASTILFAGKDGLHDPLITDATGRWLALRVVGRNGTAFYQDAHRAVFLMEPDLANNFGLADEARARAAIGLLREAAYEGEITAITFDLTLHGFGASENLLTLAFRPPFLAATLCLIALLGIVGWRAFLRFGPAAVPAGPEIALGKARLIANGADLIVRARRFGLLARPYGELSARRVAERLGLARHDVQAIDTALARRLPDAEPFSRRIAQLEAARRPADILASAQALDALADRLSQGRP